MTPKESNISDSMWFSMVGLLFFKKYFYYKNQTTVYRNSNAMLAPTPIFFLCICSHVDEMYV